MAPKAKVTEAYNVWWWFACERQRIYHRRLRQEAPPWTDDTTLVRYRFTNAYRAADRVSQYLIKNVIYSEDAPTSPDDVVFRILLFKLFNRIETWEVLTAKLGTVTLADKPFTRIARILDAQLAAGRKIYSAAYIMPPARFRNTCGRKHETHLALLKAMTGDRLGDRLAETRSMEAGFNLLRAYPMIGDFLAYQFITDINYSSVVDFSETEFVAAGPGAREGLRKCFTDSGGRSDAELIRMMMEVQDEEFERLGLDFPGLFGRRLQLIDCQNLFCELAKYARVRFPALTPHGGRTRIKQKYHPGEPVETPFFPPKWGINGRVDAILPGVQRLLKPDLARYQREAARTSVHESVRGGDAITTSMLGLIGEVGEVVSELKKHASDGGAAYLAFGDRLCEELGDLLWYAADLAERRGIRLSDLVGDSASAGDVETGRAEASIRTALSLSEQAGTMSRSYEALLAGRVTDRAFDHTLRLSLARTIADLTTLTRLHRLSLVDVAAANLVKVDQVWAASPRTPAPQPRLWPETEQLPTCFDAWLSDHDGRVSVGFSVDDTRIQATPDSLTDNAYDADGYRFHDVFHFAYAAVLDWSPVTRSLLKRKRKSDAQVDEVEDGGRAVAIEEGISAMVFAYAGRHSMLRGARKVDEGVLRTIRDMTAHLEVGARTGAEWQQAILQGFDAWRAISGAGGGCVRVDRRARRISLVGEEGTRI